MEIWRLATCGHGLQRSTVKLKDITPDREMQAGCSSVTLSVVAIEL